MLQQECQNNTCVNLFRARRAHDLCRRCFKLANGFGRPIHDREKKRHAYRRPKYRRRLARGSAPSTPKKQRKGKET